MTVSMRILKIILLLVLMPISAAAEERYHRTTELKKHPEFLACEKDEECTVVEAKMCSYYFAVNKAYAKAALDKVTVHCRIPYPPYPDAAAICLDKECVRDNVGKQK